MKHIGIAACSAEGAALCYRSICQQARAVVGNNDHPRITLDSIALARWMPAFDRGDWCAIADILLDSTRLLAAAGCDFAICPDNSAHPALELLERESPLPWLHIGRVVAEAAAQRGAHRIGVLGTRFTMAAPVYPRALAARGLEAVLPEAADAATVDRIIFDELIDGVIDEGSRAAFVGVIARLAARGCDAVALACTEIPLLVRPHDSPLPTLDSTRLLAAAALARAVR